ncbi:hypothetical protein, partial [Pseudomonas marginalis]
AKQPQNQPPKFYPKKPGDIDRAAPHPSAGQACSPQKFPLTGYSPWRAMRQQMQLSNNQLTHNQIF